MRCRDISSVLSKNQTFSIKDQTSSIPTITLEHSLGRAPHLKSTWPSAILKRRQIMARG